MLWMRSFCWCRFSLCEKWINRRNRCLKEAMRKIQWIQDINNRSESDEEDREPPSRPYRYFFWKKEKEQRGQWWCTHNTYNAKESKNRQGQLNPTIKDKFWRTVQSTPSIQRGLRTLQCSCKVLGNPSLGYWCNNMRSAYDKIQKGMKANANLSQDRIERLEKIGFHYDVAFEKRCRELMAFQEDFGHCIVPRHSRSAVASWWHSKRSLDTALFLKDMQTIHHWDIGVTTWDQHPRKSKREWTQVPISQRGSIDWKRLASNGKYKNTKLLHACMWWALRTTIY